MRVVAGAAGGRRLHGPPAGAPTRPTPDRVREALFSILGALEGARVLDLYAGTGALGIEALSRGAAHATFVEKDRAILEILGRNLAELGFGDRAAVVPRDVRAALERELRTAGPWDLVLADPPYAAPDHVALLDAVAPLLAPEGMVLLEHAARTPAPVPETLRHDRTRRWGDTAVSFYTTGPAGP